MRRVGFITEKCKIDLISEDQLIRQVLAEKDISIFPIAWDDFDIGAYQKLDMAVIRTPWNYYENSELFLSWLSKIEKLPVKLHNPASTIRWNMNKLYLQELEAKGANCLPTLFFKTHEFRIDLDWPVSSNGLYILKPTISASANRTFKGDRLMLTDIVMEEDVFKPNETLMVQPFAQTIESQGEFSFLFFDGEYSHALVKRPKSNDFRVQAEHGGSWDYFTPTSSQLRAAKSIMEAFGQSPLYARVDMVEYQDQLALMELEAFEPMFYINNEKLALNFANAIEKRLQSI
jgi:glutathione synthase/RimK-type ligase-like ATP-grasp enzyme